MANNKPKVDTSGIQADLTKSITNAITEGFKTAGAAFSSLSGDISKAVTDGFKDGSNKSKKHLEGKTLLESMNAELESINKQEKESAFAAEVRNLALNLGITAREAELQIINDQYQATASNVEEQFKLNKALGLAEYAQAKARGDLEGMLKIRKDLLQLGIENKASGFSANEAKETKEANNQLQAKIKLGRILEEQDKKREAVAEKMHEVKRALLAQVGITGKLIDQFKTPEMAKAIFAEQMGEKIHEAYESFEEFHKSGLSAGQAIEAQFKSFSIASLMGLSDTKGVMKGMIEQYGTVNALSKETVGELGSMAHHFGISGEEALKLNATLSQIPGETSESAAHAMEMTGHLAEMQGIAPGKIMADMAKNTGEMSRQGNKGAEAFGKSVIALHKMGVEMGTASKIADGLLDFESSINAQMEASTLLGREINLDKARELALNNDLEGMTREIAKNIGGSAEFSKLNRLQQDALAKSVGMTTEELAKQMDAQEETNKYFGEAASPLDNLLGGVMSVGGGVVQLAKDYGMMALTLVQTAVQYSAMLALKAANLTATTAETTATSGNIIMTKLSAAGQFAWNVIKGIGITIANSAIGVWIAEKAAIMGNYIATGASAVATGAWNTIKFISNALGLTAVGTWIAETAAKLANVGATTATAAATVTLAGAQGTATVASAGASGAIIAFGAALGTASVGMAAAVPPLLGIGLAILMVTPAIYVIGEVIKSLAEVIGKVLIKALEMLPAIIGAVVSGFVTIFGLLAANWKILIPVGFGMMALAVGVTALGAAFMFAFPGLMMGALAMTMMAVPIAVIGASLEYVASSAVGLTAVGAAMSSIGSGLGLMATNGLAAMPIIGALMALAAVAPALKGLGSVLGGGGDSSGGKKEDKMDTLIAKIDTLIGVASKGGVINMDGKKVGEVIRQGLNTTGVR